MNKASRIARQSGTPSRSTKLLCLLSERLERISRRAGIIPGINGHTPQPGGWWYRMDLDIPFTGSAIGYVSPDGWRFKRAGQAWRSL